MEKFTRCGGVITTFNIFPQGLGFTLWNEASMQIMDSVTGTCVNMDYGTQVTAKARGPLVIDV